MAFPFIQRKQARPMMAGVYWREAGWLWLAALPALLWLLNHWSQRQRWRRIADASLLPWVRANSPGVSAKLRLFSLFAGWVLLCIAMAGPRTIARIPPEQQPDPAALIFVIDLSASMNAQDISPDRRGAVGRLIQQWLQQLDDGVSVATVVFAGHSFELHPATSDQEIVQFFISNLAQLRLPTLGNNLPDALKRATAMWPQKSSSRRLIIFSDGDMEADMRQQATTRLQALGAQADLETILIGVGGNKAVTVPDRRGNLILQDARPVLTRLQARWMKQAAQSQPRLRYLAFRDARRQSLQQVLRLAPLKLDAQAQKNILWKPWFPLFVIAGLVLILLSLSPRQSSTSIASIALALTLIAVLAPTPSQAASSQALAQAQQALAQHHYQQAIQRFKPLNGYAAKFGLGVACFRIEDYACAKTAFTAAVLQADTTEQQAPAIFNLGNSYFFLGDYDQAEVLFRDAGLHGVAPDKVAINLAYARDMQDALQRHIKDIRETLRRAQWRAAASGDLPPELDDLLANDRSMMMPGGLGDRAPSFYQAYQKVFEQQLKQLLGVEQGDATVGARNWVKTEQKAAQPTAALLNRLFEMETGILAPQQQAQAIRGRRRW